MPDESPAYVIPARKQKREIRFQVDRYLKQNDLPLTKSNFYFRKVFYPYWKIDAIRLKASRSRRDAIRGNSNLLTTQLDYGGIFQYGRAVGAALTSGGTTEEKSRTKLSPYTVTASAGPLFDGIPPSIGLRTEYVTAYPFTRDSVDEEFAYFPVVIDEKKVIADAARSVAHKAKLNAGSGGWAVGELFQPVGSLIYFPYFVVETDTPAGKIRLILDGQSGRIVHSGPIDDDSKSSPVAAAAAMKWGELKVEFHRCRNCGVDLDASRSSIYICRNCQAVTSIDGKLKIDGGVEVVAARVREDDIYFPFWSLTLSSEIVQQSGLKDGDDHLSNRILIPAFEIRNFDVVGRLSRKMSRAVSEMPLGIIERDHRKFHPAAVDLQEALALAEIIVYINRLSRNRSLRAEKINISPEKVGLVYAPFHPQNYFFVDSALERVTFEKQLVGDTL